MKTALYLLRVAGLGLAIMAALVLLAFILDRTIIFALTFAGAFTLGYYAGNNHG